MSPQEPDHIVDSNQTARQVKSLRYAKLLKVCFDFLYKLSAVLLGVGIIYTLLLGFFIPADAIERHTDINYWFNAKILPVGVTDPSASEVLLAHGMFKLNNTTGLAAWYIAKTEIWFNGIIMLLGLFNLRKLFANLAANRAFDSSNVTYIKRLGLIVLSYSVLAPAITYFCGMAILADIGQFNEQVLLSPYFTFPVEGLLTGGALIVLAQVIKDASAMKEEQSLTI